MISRQLIKIPNLLLILTCCILFVPDYKKPPIKIFQIGFNKSGTSTLAHFFNANGIKSVHYDHGQIAETMYQNYLNNKPLLNNSYANEYIGFFDMTSIHTGTIIDMNEFFVLLDQQYPGSKFILNTRDKQNWLRSRTNHKTKYGYTFLEKCAQINNVSTDEMIAMWSRKWDEHHESVIRYFNDRPQDLIVFNIETEQPQKLVDFFKDYYRLDPSLYEHKNKTKTHL